jgi:hypothetical protein
VRVSHRPGLAKHGVFALLLVAQVLQLLGAALLLLAQPLHFGANLCGPAKSVSEWSCREAAGGSPESAREPSPVYPAGRVSE